jgi:hypothetical protein
VLGNEPVDILDAAARRFCHFLPAQAVAVNERQEAVGQRFALQAFQFDHRLGSPRLPFENLIHAGVAHAGHIPDGAPRQTERGHVANRRFASASSLPYNGRLRGCASNRVLVERRKELPHSVVEAFGVLHTDGKIPLSIYGVKGPLSTASVLDIERHRRYTVPMARCRFRIGAVFPADDPVARFVTVLAMMSNYWHRSMRAIDAATDDEDGPGIRLMLARQQAAFYYEATKFIADTGRSFPSEVEGFIASLDESTKGHYDRTMAGLDTKSPHYQGWLKDHRNVTFHFPLLHPERDAHGDEEIANALISAANLEGTITAEDTIGSVRFEFADEVGVQMLPDIVDDPDVIKELGDATVALGLFMHGALLQYVESRPPGTIVAEP